MPETIIQLEGISKSYRSYARDIDRVLEILTGKSSDPFHNRAFADKVSHAKSGQRHQTDVFALHKPRPRPAMTK